MYIVIDQGLVPYYIIIYCNFSMYAASPSPYQLVPSPLNYVSAIAHYKYLNAISVMTQATSSASVVKDLLAAAAEGRLHEVQSLLDGGRCRVNDENEVCTSRGTSSELSTKLMNNITLVHNVHKYIKETNADMAGSHKCTNKAHAWYIIY